MVWSTCNGKGFFISYAFFSLTRCPDAFFSTLLLFAFGALQFGFLHLNVSASSVTPSPGAFFLACTERELLSSFGLGFTLLFFFICTYNFLVLLLFTSGAWKFGA